jgi:hypothetical protein
MSDQPRDYAAIGASSHLAREGVLSSDVNKLGEGVSASYSVQLGEGMSPLPEAKGCLGRKYCGGGFGGYALYLFGREEDRRAFLAETADTLPIEPYSNWE